VILPEPCNSLTYENLYRDAPMEKSAVRITRFDALVTSVHELTLLPTVPGVRQLYRRPLARQLCQ
jgi:hypothetical protein